MNLAISNLAWNKDDNIKMYEFISNSGFQGLEIAPTKLFSNRPYNCIKEAVKYKAFLKKEYNLKVVSLQSIWYGKNDTIFGSQEERKNLYNYTKEAIEFSNALECPNIVFGCPKNRIIKNANQWDIAVEFFSNIGEAAFKHGVFIAIEPNPRIYNTNFINTTNEAIKFCNCIQSKGLKVNLDFGTIIENKEIISFSQNDINLINHVHISEPNLKLIKERDEHYKLKKVLLKYNYKKFISIEMGDGNNLKDIKKTIEYIGRVFK